MPANLIPATVVPGRVLPKSLSTSFTEAQSFPLLSVTYADGTFERSLIVDGVNPPRPLRIWTLAKRLSTAQLTALWNLFDLCDGGLNPFYFYDPYAVVPPNHIGSNYDSMGTSTLGRATCIFRGNWAQHTELGRHVVPSVVLVEIA